MMVEFLADGTVIYYMHEAHITLTGAGALETVLNSARDAYHQAWNLPEVATALVH